MKLANMHGSGPCAFMGLRVQLPPSAQINSKLKNQNIKLYSKIIKMI